MVRKRRNNKIKEQKTEIAENVDRLLRICTTSPEKNIQKALETQQEISVIISKLQYLEHSYVNKSLNDNIANRASIATIKKFVDWVTENGAILKGCEICEFDGYELGLKVTSDLNFSSLVLAVPRKLILTVKNAHKSDLKQLLEKDQLLKGMPTVALSIFLLYEKFKGNSFWQPYFDILPESYTTGLYFSLDELEELRGSPTLENTLKLNKSIARQYAYFYKLFHTCEDSVSRLMRDKFTYEGYRWAVSTMMTRQNAIPSEDGENQLETALIPLWDMCNHANGTISTDYNVTAQRIECLAVKNFMAGEQLFIHYGDRTNADFFVNGFVYEENIHDGYWLKLGISKSDPLQEKRSDLLNRLSLEPTDQFFIRKGSDPIDGQLLAFLRVFNMDEEQLDKWLLTTPLNQLERSECIHPDLDQKVWKFLQTRLKLLQGQYKTTLQEDLKLLKRNDLSANRRLAIRMRMTEKRIFEDALEYVTKRIQV